MQYQQLIDVAISPFFTYLKASFNHPHFMRAGGVLGFTCQHLYIFEEFNRGNFNFKGSDRTIFLAAKSLGLKIQVKSIITDTTSDNNEQYIHDVFEFKYIEDEDDWENNFEEKGIDDDSQITWCQTHTLQKQLMITPFCIKQLPYYLLFLTGVKDMFE